jgi:hypothetical protein
MSRCTARTGQDAAWTWSASNRPPARTSPAISSRAPRSSRMAHSEKVHTTTSTASQPPSAGRVPSPPTRRPGEGDLGRCRVVPPGHPPDQIDERLIRDSVVLGEAGGSCGELTGASDQRSGIVTGHKSHRDRHDAGAWRRCEGHARGSAAAARSRPVVGVLLLHESLVGLLSVGVGSHAGQQALSLQQAREAQGTSRGATEPFEHGVTVAGGWFRTPAEDG